MANGINTITFINNTGSGLILLTTCALSTRSSNITKDSLGWDIPEGTSIITATSECLGTNFGVLPSMMSTFMAGVNITIGSDCKITPEEDGALPASFQICDYENANYTIVFAS